MLRNLFRARRTREPAHTPATRPPCRPRLEGLEDRLAPATLPVGFTQTLVANLSSPTTMDFAPDGRLFVSLQGGDLRVIRNDSLLTAPFLHLTVDSRGERGLLGVTFDADFTTDHYVYVYYTVPGTGTGPSHNRVSRFTANGDLAVPGSEVALLDLPNLSLTATNHNGGSIHFGPDGKLYVSVGENANPANAQNLNTRLGKILRLNPDGSIPADNPTSFQGLTGTTTGDNRAIWAVGLRNPFTFAFQPGTGRLFLNDVGSDGPVSRERIFEGAAGANYGWNTVEGYNTNPRFTGPLYAYPRTLGGPGGVALTGGAFYNPGTNQFPAQYTGQYFFSDYLGNWIDVLNPADLSVSEFATNLSAPVDLKVGPDGSLYYAGLGAAGQPHGVFKIQPTGAAEQIVGTQDAGYWDTGGWYDYPDGYSGTIRTAPAGIGTEVAAWQVTGQVGGNYDVQVTWPAYDSAATNAAYQVYDGATLVRTVVVDQTQAPVGTPVNGWVFQSLGPVTLSSGTLTVALSDDANSYVVADAVRAVGALRPLGSINVDNNDPARYTEAGPDWVGYTGDGYNGNLRYAPAGSGGDTAAWQVTGLLAGTYDVQLTWPGYDFAATQATYQIYDGAALLQTVRVDQTQAPTGTTTHGTTPINGRVFQSLYRANVTSGTLRVVLSDTVDGDGYLIADALRLVQTA